MPKKTKKTAAPLPSSKGLTIPRLFTEEGKHPFETVTWEKRVSTIT